MTHGPMACGPMARGPDPVPGRGTAVAAATPGNARGIGAGAMLHPTLFAAATPGAPGWPALGEDEAHLWLLPLDWPAASAAAPDPAELAATPDLARLAATLDFARLAATLDVATLAATLDFATLAATLDVAERARAARFHFARDRDRFVAGRGLLRHLLGAYAGLDPAALRFTYGPFGKPALMPGPRHAPAEAPLAFNLAHSGGWALLGVARRGAIGVDLEQVRDLPEHLALARGTFAPNEVRALQALPPARQQAGFFAGWACKEACVKLRGTGLSEPLDGFEVSVDPDAPAALRAVGGPAAAQLWGGEVPPGYWAAVAVSGPATVLRPLRLAGASPGGGPAVRGAG